MATKKKTPSKAQETNLRHAWLAGLGLVAIARRETLNAANEATARIAALKQQAGKLADEAQSNVRDGIACAREQGEARVGQFSADVESRLAPVLVKLGLKPKPTAKKRGRKPAKKARKTKKPARKAKKAKKPAKKKARKPAQKKVKKARKPAKKKAPAPAPEPMAPFMPPAM